MPDGIQKSRRMSEIGPVVLARSGRWNAGSATVLFHPWHPKSFLVVVGGRRTSKASKFSQYGAGGGGGCGFYEYATNGEELSRGRAYGRRVVSLQRSMYAPTSFPVRAVDVRDDRSEGQVVIVLR